MSYPEIILYLFLAVATIGALYTRKKEIEAFNDGECSCGGGLKMFDRDSQGGTGWRCSRCGIFLWTSWVKAKKT